MAMVGKQYSTYGDIVTVLAQWRHTNGGSPLPPVENVLVRYADGRREVRPFRGLHATPVDAETLVARRAAALRQQPFRRQVR